MERKEDKPIIKLKEKLDSPWMFYSHENAEEGVKVDKELILDKELDFISIIVDFYTSEALHKNASGYLNESIDNEIIREVSDNYAKLLSLKLFYQNELSDILENREFLYNDVLDFWQFVDLFHFAKEFELEVLFYGYRKLKVREDIYERYLSQNEKLILKLAILNIIFLRILYRNTDRINDIFFEEIINLEDYPWKYLFEISTGILSKLDNDKRRTESGLFCLNTVDLNRIGTVFAKYDMASLYFDEITKLKLEKFEKNKINCYASVRKNNIIYMTLNGVKDDSIKVNGVDRSNLQKVVDILAQLLGGDVEYVSISPDTRYYINPDLYINYSQYKNSNENLNRMFTCCERKLIAKMFTLKFGDDEKIELLVTKYPCKICLRTIDYVNNKEGAKLKIEIIDPLEMEFKLSEQDIIEMDKCAEKIDKNHPREQEE